MSEKQELSLDTLKKVMFNLADVADEMRRGDDSYAKMLEASEKGIRGLLDHAESEMTSIALNLADVIEQRFGRANTPNDLWHLICALPYARQAIEAYISKNEGIACSVDKARELFAQVALRMLQPTPTTEAKS